VISRDSDVMGGTPVFCGTRVPVQTLIEYLDAGETIDAFLEGFPSVTREQVIAPLESSLSSRPDLLWPPTCFFHAFRCRH
jgi:uncharacterized protein (DUF433 family)